MIELPKPQLKGKISLEEAVLKRHSVREYENKDLSIQQISNLLWTGQGIIAKKYGMSFKTAPSAGALYPMEVYFLNKDGIFHYIPDGHKIDKKIIKDTRKELCDAALGQECIKNAPLNIVICAVYKRTTIKYGERGIRYVWIEAGHIAQNILLQAVSLGLSGVPIGAFYDDKVKEILNLPDNEEPLYIIPIGYPKLNPATRR